ncbi:MAG: LexA family transcriptional regulator [Microscillaceae bacterium]|nr:LexA family transcriptional regulator [Microscillaceae bacterium]
MNQGDKIGEKIENLRIQKGLSQEELAERLEISQGHLSNIVKGKKNLTLGLVDNLKEIFDVSLDWLLYDPSDSTSERNRKRPNYSQSIKNNSVVSEPDSKYNQPKVNALRVSLEPPQKGEGMLAIPVESQAGYVTNFKITDSMNQLERINLPGFFQEEGEYRAFQVSGDSMFPTIKNGDWAICKSTNLQDVLPGQAHIIISKSHGILCKRAEVNENGLALYSDNKRYKPFFLSADKIDEIWAVRSLLTKSFDSDYDLKQIK